LKTVGILALQGCVSHHQKMLESVGAKSLLVKSVHDLKNIDGLILPGGESTTMLNLLKRTGLFEELKLYGATNPIWGICAGAILAAKKVTNPEQESFGWIEIEAVRNAYGSQLDSFNTDLTFLEPLSKSCSVDFIRAPKLKPLSDSVKILAYFSGLPVLMQQQRVLVASFHTELGSDNTLHKYFIDSFY